MEKASAKKPKRLAGGGKSLAARIRGVLFTLILGAAIGAAIMLSLRQKPAEPPAAPAITSDTILEEIRRVRQLVVLEYHYKNVGELKDQKDFRGIPIPFTGRKILYTFKGVIKAGVNMGEIVPFVDEETKTVTLTIPEGRIISHEMPPEEVKPYDESTSLFSNFTMNDYTSLLADRKAQVQREFMEEGYLPEVQREAGEALKALLALAPGMDGYTLQIEYQAADAEID